MVSVQQFINQARRYQVSGVRALFSTPSGLSLGDRADRGEVKPEAVANLLKLAVIKTNGIVDTGIAI